MEFDILRNNIIGERQSITTPFGEKPLVYADYTASGRAYEPIEQFIRDHVLPTYANTHSESSLTGRQTNALREEARQIIADAVHAGEEQAVIFCGSGATAAINKLVDILGLRDACEKTVVFIGAYEHHSNELPWRESNAEVVVIPLDEEGSLDLDVLEQQLKHHQGQARLLASFSAASNVTGLRTDTDRVSTMVHAYGGRIFWDYAAAAPYVAIDAGIADAVFISPHKFLGGPGTPGILVVRRDLFLNQRPTQPGGGTVAFVGPDFHRYLDDCVRREEGGTPAIVESIRAGLVFRLQQSVGLDTIEAREKELVGKAIARLGSNPRLRLLGNLDKPRLSILSLQFLHRDSQLHYGFVVALLNDLFGIQARGGCSCAGPYGHSLLGIDRESSHALDAEVARGNGILRPGWVRLNFNYFIDDETFDYLLSAIELVAEQGHRMLPWYRYDTDSGTWRYRGITTPLAASLDDWDPCSASARPGRTARQPLTAFMEEAANTLAGPDRGRAADQSEYLVDHGVRLDEQAEKLRWFSLP